MKLITRIAIPFVVLGLAACGSSSSSSSSSSTSSQAPATSSSTSAKANAAPSGGSVQVSMKSLAFAPKVIHAKVGQTVQWTNDDSPAHNVTYVSGPKFTSSGTMNPGAKFQIKVTHPGTVQYFCSIHPFMKASIIVTT
jgi:plastocyanin